MHTKRNNQSNKSAGDSNSAADPAGSFALLERMETGRFRVCHASPELTAGAEAFGLDASDAYSLIRRLSHDRAEAATQALQAVAETNRPQRLTIPLTVGSEIHWLEITLHPWPSDSLPRILVLIKDVTAIQARRSEIRMLKRAVDQWPDGMAVFEMRSESLSDRRTHYVNAALCKLLKLSRQQILDMGTLQFLFVEEKGRSQLEEFTRALRDGTSLRIEVQAKLCDNSRRWIEVSIFPLTDTPGGYRAWMLICRDLSERKGTSARISFLQTIIDEAGDLVAVTDVGNDDGHGPRISYANPAFAAFLGLAQGNLLHRQLLLLLSQQNNERLLASIETSLKHLTPIAHEVRFDRPDDREAWMECTARVLRDDAGTPTGWLWLGRDLTGRRDQYRQTAELVTALDFTDEAIAVYRVLRRGEIESTYENSVYANERSFVLPWMLHDVQQRGRIPWERGEHIHLLVRFVADIGERIWLTLELRPMLSPTGTLESLVAIHHSLNRRTYKRRLNANSEATLLADEVLSYTNFDDRLEALIEILARECDAVAHYTPAPGEPRSADVSFGQDRNTASIVMPPGVLADRAVMLRATSAKPFSSRQATALRVFLESLAEAQA